MADYKFKKILIIDDSIITRKKLGLMLNPLGCRIYEAIDGGAGIESILSDKPDIILCDLLMPKVDGFEVLKYMRDNNIKIPVFVLTADIQNSTKQLALEAGATCFLNKPPDETTLRDLVKKIFDKG